MTTEKGLMWYHDEIEEFSVNDGIFDFFTLHPFIVALYSDCFRIIELLCSICPLHVVALLSPTHPNQAMFSITKHASRDIIQHFLVLLDYNLCLCIEKTNNDIQNPFVPARFGPI